MDSVEEGASPPLLRTAGGDSRPLNGLLLFPADSDSLSRRAVIPLDPSLRPALLRLPPAPAALPCAELFQ